MNRIKLLFFLLLPACWLSAQDTIIYNYALDTIRIDSFFLEQTTQSLYGSQKRPVQHREYYYFSDTTQFNQFIEASGSELQQLVERRNRLRLDYNAWNRRQTKLEILRDSVFRGLTGFQFRAPAAPPPESMEFSLSEAVSLQPAKEPTNQGQRGRQREKAPQAASEGFWYYDSRRSVLGYARAGEPIPENSVLLKPDGKLERFVSEK